MVVILTIHHNNVGHPIPCAGLPNGYAGRGGMSPFTVHDAEATAEAVAQWRYTVERYGAAIVTDDCNYRPINHNVIGIGGGHNDAEWCESRFLEGSHAAWKENGKGERLDSATFWDGRSMYPREIDGFKYLDI